MNGDLYSHSLVTSFNMSHEARENGCLCPLHIVKQATSQALLPLTYPASEKASVELALAHSIISEQPTFLTISEETWALKDSAAQVAFHGCHLFPTLLHQHDSETRSLLWSFGSSTPRLMAQELALILRLCGGQSANRIT